MAGSSYTKKRLDELRPFVERASRMRGWTFDVHRVPLGPGLTWDYVARARELLASANSVLDMGTGGGERFSELCTVYSGLAVATDGWPPNVRVA